jgi:hypothetical protein
LPLAVAGWKIKKAPLRVPSRFELKPNYQGKLIMHNAELVLFCK